MKRVLYILIQMFSGAAPGCLLGGVGGKMAKRLAEHCANPERRSAGGGGGGCGKIITIMG